MKSSLSFFQIVSILIVSLGGFLFGYNLAVISGALHFLSQQFSLSATFQGVVVASPLFGALVGSSVAGYLSDEFGRRNTLLFTAFLFCVGALVTSLASTIWVVLLGRFLSGFAVGVVSLSAPLYLAEIAPSHLRGTIVSCNQFAITIGIFAAYLVNLLCCPSGVWRAMFAWGLLPAILQFIGLFFLKESHAVAALTPKEKAPWSALLTPSIKPLLLIGMALSMFQQITGINGVIFFAPEILAKAGFSSHSGAVLATLGIGAVNMLATVVALQLLDRSGRRRLLFIGLGGMAACLLLLATAFLLHVTEIALIAVICLMGYVAFFAMSLGPITWLIVSEIYPLRIRGRAMGIAVLTNWFFCFIFSLFFLDLFRGLGTVGAFFLFGALSVVGIVFVLRYVPETKGKSLEEIEKQLSAHYK